MDRTIPSDANVFVVLFSTDGALLHGLCSDLKLRSWDAASGALRRTIAFDPGDAAPSLTPAGLTTIGKDGALKSWDLASGKVTGRLPAAGFRRAAKAPDGSFVLANSATDTRVRAVDVSGKERFTVPAGHGGLGSLAVSPDGRNVVAASYDADVRAWNARNGELLRLIDELPVSMFDMKFSPDGKLLAAAGADRTVYLYDTATWHQRSKWSGQPEMISSLAFSPDGKRLATGGFSELTVKHPVKVLVWDVATGKPQRTVDAPARVSSVAFSPDGQTLAVAAGQKSVALWSV